jgi:hypothetical protein
MILEEFSDEYYDYIKKELDFNKQRYLDNFYNHDYFMVMVKYNRSFQTDELGNYEDEYSNSNLVIELCIDAIDRFFSINTASISVATHNFQGNYLRSFTSKLFNPINTESSVYNQLKATCTTTKEKKLVNLSEGILMYSEFKNNLSYKSLMVDVGNLSLKTKLLDILYTLFNTLMKRKEFITYLSNKYDLKASKSEVDFIVKTGIELNNEIRTKPTIVRDTRRFAFTQKFLIESEMEDKTKKILFILPILLVIELVETALYKFCLVNTSINKLTKENNSITIEKNSKNKRRLSIFFSDIIMNYEFNNRKLF